MNMVLSSSQYRNGLVSCAVTKPPSARGMLPNDFATLSRTGQCPATSRYWLPGREQRISFIKIDAGRWLNLDCSLRVAMGAALTNCSRTA